MNLETDYDLNQTHATPDERHVMTWMLTEM